MSRCILKTAPSSPLKMPGTTAGTHFSNKSLFQRAFIARLHALVFLLLCYSSSATANGAEIVPEKILFRRDVMAVFSKAGCNAGLCHGNQSGKGGFRLSLWGQDPETDYRTVTRDLLARRINVLDPDASLLLLKPTMIVGHEGGHRFTKRSLEYQILHRWISSGAKLEKESLNLTKLAVLPREKIVLGSKATSQLKVWATFSDGSRRDVTRMAVYEPSNSVATISQLGQVRRETFGQTTILVRYLDFQTPVRFAFVPDRPGYQPNMPPAANYIDRHLFAKLKSLRMNPSDRCSDEVFVRRLYLDILGVLPTAKEARQFISVSRDDKRARLIDRLLSRPEYADHWALKWSDLLRNEEKLLDRTGVTAFHRWIRQSVAQDKPLNTFVAELIAARGSTYKNPPANYYRALRDPISRGEASAQVFLGLRIGCAKCHNHPFERITRDDYYQWAGFFSRINYKIVKNGRRDKFDKHEFVGEQMVQIADVGEMLNPRTQQPAPPKFLGGVTPSLSAKEDRLVVLSKWIGRPDNRRMALVQANRIWANMMGLGLVNPVDDFRATNPASNPALLEALADDLMHGDWRPRNLIRSIANSRAYQLSSRPNDTNGEDQTHFSRAIIRRLSAEQMLDSVSGSLGFDIEFNGYPRGTRAGQLSGVQAIRPREKKPSDGDLFLKTFGKPARLMTSETERSEETTLAQTFTLISGRLIHQALSDPDNRVAKLAKTKMSDPDLIDELFWSIVTRAPTKEEQAAFGAHLKNTKDRKAATVDIGWALINSKEFMFRH